MRNFALLKFSIKFDMNIIVKRLFAIFLIIGIVILLKLWVGDNMEFVIILLSTIFFILNIILFFKLWGACDNIKRIADKYAPEKDNKSQRSRTPETREDVEHWLNEDK